MNAAQRRKAYRALPKPGAGILWPRKNGTWRSGKVIGATAPVRELSSTNDMSGYSGTRPSGYRVRVDCGGVTYSPKLKRAILQGGAA